MDFAAEKIVQVVRIDPEFFLRREERCNFCLAELQDLRLDERHRGPIEAPNVLISCFIASGVDSRCLHRFHTGITR